MLIITVVSGPDKGVVFRLPDDQPHRIGRRHGSVPLNDKGASSRHAEIAPAGDGSWTVRDMGSSNGTYVNGDRIHDAVELRDGDRVQVGRSMLVFTVAPGADRTGVHEPAGDAHAHAPAAAGIDAETAALLHDAVEAQRRNHVLLAEIRAMLDERTGGGEGEHAAAVSAEVAALMRQVVDRLDDLTARPVATPAPAVAPDPRVDDVLDQLRALRQRESIVVPAPEPVDLDPVLDAIAALKPAPRPPEPEPVDLTPVLGAIESLRSQLATPAPAAAPVDLSPVLGQIAALSNKLTPAAPVDLAPVIQAVESLKTASPASPSAPAPAVDLKPVIDAVASLKASMPVPAAPVDLKPIIDAVESLKKSIPAPSVPVDLSPVALAVQELKASLPTAPPPVDLKPVIDAVESLKSSLPGPAPAVDLKPVLDAVESLRSAKPVSSEPDPAAAAEREALKQKLDALAAEVKAAGDRKPDLAPVLDAVATVSARVDSLKPTGDDAARAAALHQRLDELAQSITDLRAAATGARPDTDASLAELRLQLAEVAAKLDTPQSAMHEKLDQLLDAATSPAPAPAASPAPHDAERFADAVARLTELRTVIESLAARLPAGGASPIGGATESDVAARVFERIDAMEAALAERVERDRLADLAVIDEKIDAIVDVLRAMDGVRESGEGPAAGGAITSESIEELGAKLSVIYEAIEASRGESRTLTVAGGELDSLIEMVRSESESTDAVAALEKVCAKLDGMASPAPVLDPELLQRLENVSMKLEKFQLMAVDFPDPRGLIEQKLEPLIRQVHETVTKAEPVDLSGTERRLAELAETVRDAMGRTDRPLLEQILIELRQRTAGVEGGVAGLDADKIELILERLGRMQSVTELGPIVEKLQHAVDASSNDKIIALLRQLIEYVQKMPSRFDGKEVMDNVFQSLRRLEQQQESQAASIRRLIAAVAQAEASVPASSSVEPAAPARPSVASRAALIGRSPRVSVAAPPVEASTEGESIADELIASSDPSRGAGGRSRLLTLALIVAVPLGLFAAFHLVQEAGRVDQMKRPDAPASQPLDPAQKIDERVGDAPVDTLSQLR